MYSGNFGSRKVIADDNSDSISVILTKLHLPDHKGMKAMYMALKGSYIGFRRVHIENYVRQLFHPVHGLLFRWIALISESMLVSMMDMDGY